jgi:hypothetical protein
MNRKLLPILIAALAALALTACSVTAPAAEQPHTINVTGYGAAYGAPDIATAQIGVETRNADPARAVSANTEKMNAVIAAIKKLGVEDKDIQTTNFSVYAQQNYDANGQPTDITYVVTNTVSVTVRDLNKVGEVLGKATAAGANSVNGVSFSVSEAAALEAEARGNAMADAKARAGQLADAAGVALDKPLSISEYTITPVYYDGGKQLLALEAGGGAPVPISTGQYQVTVQVSVTYLIK